MKDRTGRELRVGDIIDVQVNRMMECIVTEIHDHTVVVPKQGEVPPYVKLQPAPFMNVSRDGATLQNVYVVGHIQEEPGKEDKPPSRLSIV